MINFLNLYDESKKIIGWGTGGVFTKYYNSFKLNFSYLIDSDSKKWGTTFEGIPIYSPDKLKEENANNSVIIIFSTYHIEISCKIREYGQFQILNALNELDKFLMPMQVLNNVSDKGYYENKSKDSEVAIVIQGPIYPVITIKVLKYYRNKFSNCTLIVSTWEDTNNESLSEVKKYVDYCILSKKPDFAGMGNRNYQIVSTKNGIAKAIEIGAKKIMKVRTDMVVLGENVLEHFDYIIDSFDSSLCKRFGLKGRIIANNHGTYKYLPYTVSDFMLYGYAEDIQKYWNCDLDERIFDEEYEIRNRSIDYIAQNLIVAENYITSNFCNTIGYERKFTLEDSWNFIRDFFAVVDHNWCQLVSLKYLMNYNMFENLNTITNYFWQQLNLKLVNYEKVNIDIQKEKFTLHRQI